MAELYWLEEEWSEGLTLLGTSRVHYHGLKINLFNPHLIHSGIWLMHNKNEAILLDAPFVLEESGYIIDKIEHYLNVNQLHLKFITVSHLHRDHAEGRPALLGRFPQGTFVYPASWRRDWRSFPKNIDHKSMPAFFDREYHVEYESSWQGDLAGEPLWFYRTPYHSLTDQIVNFRGTAVLPDWHLPNDIGQKVNLANAPHAEKIKTVKLLQDTWIHSHLPVHANGGIEHDFQHRLYITEQNLKSV
jgi:hypothetical protein